MFEQNGQWSLALLSRLQLLKVFFLKVLKITKVRSV
jgi:hypothetical protein